MGIHERVSAVAVRDNALRWGFRLVVADCGATHSVILEMLIIFAYYAHNEPAHRPVTSNLC